MITFLVLSRLLQNDTCSIKKGITERVYIFLCLHVWAYIFYSTCLYVPDFPWRVGLSYLSCRRFLWGCSDSGSLSRCQHGLRSVIMLISVTCIITVSAHWMLSDYLVMPSVQSVRNSDALIPPQTIPRKDCPYRAVYTMIVSSLIALLLAYFLKHYILPRKYVMTKGRRIERRTPSVSGCCLLLFSNWERLEVKVPDIKADRVLILAYNHSYTFYSRIFYLVLRTS
jgi:hypothetical protein